MPLFVQEGRTARSERSFDLEEKRMRPLSPLLARRRTLGLLALAGTAALAPLAPALAGGLPMLRDTNYVSPGYERTYTVTFEGGEPALVAARGDGDIDIEVRDEYGN